MEHGAHVLVLHYRLTGGSAATRSLQVQTARLLAARGVAMEHVTTSPLAQLYGVCNPNRALRELCASVDRFPEWIPPSDWQGRHVSVLDEDGAQRESKHRAHQG